jgi:hypothetical protein
MRTSHREKSSAAKWYVGCWLSAVGCLLSPALLAEGRAADWAVTRYTEGAGTLINGTTGRIVPGAPFDISVPLPGTTRWNLIGVDTDDADTLFVLNAGNAAGYRVDWEALSTTWANLTAQRYFMHFAQGSVERSSAFSPLSFTVAPDTTLHSVDMRFTTTVINGSTPLSQLQHRYEIPRLGRAGARQLRARVAGRGGCELFSLPYAPSCSQIVQPLVGLGVPLGRDVVFVPLAHVPGGFVDG